MHTQQVHFITLRIAFFAIRFENHAILSDLRANSDFTRTCCCCFLTLTDPLRIQPWSQDRRNQTKSNRESEMSMESRQKKDGQEVASKGHRRDKIENINKKHTDSRNKLEPTA